jgi:hypothetical protein
VNLVTEIHAVCATLVRSRVTSVGGDWLPFLCFESAGM